MLGAKDTKRLRSKQFSPPQNSQSGVDWSGQTSLQATRTQVCSKGEGVQCCGST